MTTEHEHDNDDSAAPPTLVFESMAVWFDRWFSVTVARRLSGTAGGQR